MNGSEKVNSFPAYEVHSDHFNTREEYRVVQEKDEVVLYRATSDLVECL